MSYNISVKKTSGQLPFEHFLYAMNYIRLEPHEQYWPACAFVPKEGTRWRRSFSRHAPHGKGRSGKYERYQILELRQHLARALDLGTHAFERE